MSHPKKVRPRRVKFDKKEELECLAIRLRKERPDLYRHFVALMKMVLVKN
jgi:hypothetical protein